MAKKGIKGPLNYLNDGKELHLKRDLLNSSMTSKSSGSNREDYSTISSKPTKATFEQVDKKRRIEAGLSEDEENDNKGSDNFLLTMCHKLMQDHDKFKKILAHQDKKFDIVNEKFKVINELNKRNSEIINRLDAERISNVLDDDHQTKGSKNVKKRKILSLKDVDDYFRLKFQTEFDLIIGNFTQIKAVM
jgi:hypothetical protein